MIIISKQQKWAMYRAIPQNKFISILKFLFTPIKPEKSIIFSLYSFFIWKLMMILSVAGLIKSKQIRNFVFHSHYKLIFTFLIIIYSIF